MTNDNIRGNSPDTDLDPESEIPNNGQPPTVRDILIEIHTAAQQSHYSRHAYKQTLLYIEEKEQAAWSLKAEHRLKNAIYHIKAVRLSTIDPEVKMKRIELIAALALGLNSEAVQS